MLAHELRSMHESHLLTFTVTGETNREIGKSNYASSLRMYGRRANYLLRYVRAALGELEKPGS
jgi:hypothetical protein